MTPSYVSHCLTDSPKSKHVLFAAIYEPNELSHLYRFIFCWLTHHSEQKSDRRCNFHFFTQFLKQTFIQKWSATLQNLKKPFRNHDLKTSGKVFLYWTLQNRMRNMELQSNDHSFISMHSLQTPVGICQYNDGDDRQLSFGALWSVFSVSLCSESRQLSGFFFF